MKNKIMLLLLILFIPFNVFAYSIDLKEYKTDDLNEILSSVGNQEYKDTYQNEKGLPIYFFYGKECGFSKDFVDFYVDKVLPQYKDKIHIVGFEIWHDSKNKELMNQVLEYKNITYDGSPLIVIGDRVFEGYISSYDNQILSSIKSLDNKNIFNDMNNISDNDLSNEVKLIVLIILFIILMIVTFKLINKKSIKE